MYDETRSESKRVNKLNTVLRSSCLKQLFCRIDCLIFILYVILCPNLMKVYKQKKPFEWQNLPLLKLSQTAKQELPSHIVITEKREKAISQTCIKL